MKKYKHLFGPVPSRRLGMSLGVDCVPHKVCSLDCVYCEVGRTTLLTGERKEYVPVDAILEELADFFASSPDPDYITFSGAGEPTLNSGIGRVLAFIKKEKPGIPTAVLTNGTLLSSPFLRQELLPADVVLPSLDAASEDVFQRINRPASSLTAEQCMQGLVDFRRLYTGDMRLEVFILPGYNTGPEELALLRDAVIRINPDRVELNTLDRPGTESGLRAATRSELETIQQQWGLPNCEIIASAPVRKKMEAYHTDTEDVIRATIARRPCTVEDLSAVLGLHINEINKYLGVMLDTGEIESVERERGRFFRIKSSASR